MKTKSKLGRVELYKLPNHCWLPGDWCPPGSEKDTPERIVRRIGHGILVRNYTWEQAKNPRSGYSKQFCGENRPNETWKTFDLWTWGDSTIGILDQMARDGNTNAAQELARLAMKATVQLAKICEATPELVRPLSRHFRAWPVIKKVNAELSSKESALFAGIQLGADDYINLDKRAQWRFDDAGSVAHSLLNYIRYSRGKPKFGKLPHGLSNGSMSKLVKKRLPQDFDDQSADDWWEVAEEILLFSYPDPTVVQELNQLVKAESNRKPRSRFHEAILDVIKRRFLSFAKKRAPKTRQHFCDCGSPAVSKSGGEWICARCQSA